MNWDTEIFKQLAEAGKIKVVPLFRERAEYISAKSMFRKGTLFFRLKRTEELTEYLREKGLI